MTEEEFMEELRTAVEKSDYNPVKSMLCGPRQRNTYYDSTRR